VSKTAKANPFDKITSAEQKQLDELTAFMVYDYGLLFSFFEHLAVKAFL
jgi:hypothetical protein